MAAAATDKSKLTAENTASGPDASQGRSKAVATVSRHGGLDDLEGLAEGGDLEHVEASAEKQVGELDGLLLKLLGFPNGAGEGSGGNHDSRVYNVFAAEGP